RRSAPRRLRAAAATEDAPYGCTTGATGSLAGEGWRRGQDRGRAGRRGLCVRRGNVGVGDTVDAASTCNGLDVQRVLRRGRRDGV
ncbi:hypothetical protein KC218_25005, partial [Mycobacterium tuberculosis]|nr:hypothetical protein [Mycobacterium tuberculosis]